MKNLLVLTLSFLIGLFSVILLDNYQSNLIMNNNIKINNQISIDNKNKTENIVWDSSNVIFIYYKHKINIINTASSANVPLLRLVSSGKSKYSLTSRGLSNSYINTTKSSDITYTRYSNQ